MLQQPANTIDFFASQKASWICLDIETGNAPIAEVNKTIQAWKAPSNWKPETVEAKRAEFAEKAKDKAALLDASPVLCVAIKSDSRAIIFNGMGKSECMIPDWHYQACHDEKSMLAELRLWLDAYTDEQTAIVGHNIRGFDLPKLRHAYIRNRLKLPVILQPKFKGEDANEIIDTMQLGKAYSMQNRDNLFITLDTLADVLCIERPKQVIDGSQVPALHEQGRHQEILIYCAIDTATTARAFQLMTGIASELI